MENLFCTDVLLTLNNIYPIIKFKQAHNTFTVGEERPFPGGLEKGLGKESPETPCIKCGTVFAKKAPEKKAAK
jgi:hypothetical protein